MMDKEVKLYFNREERIKDAQIIYFNILIGVSFKS